MIIKKPRGTSDIFFEYNDDFEYIKNKLYKFSKLYNLNKIETPIFEEYDLFCRNKNDSSDMVKKEMYVFSDKSNRTLVLRPEGTAPVIRAVIENKLLFKMPKPLKFFYFSTMFRYERPQSGRQRQFHQYGVEIIDTNSLFDQFQAIYFAVDLLKKLKISKYILKINYIGNFESRKKWIVELQKYFLEHKNELSELSQERIDTNPMRILDDKEDSTKQCVIDAPKITSFLSDEEKKEIEQFYKILSDNNIQFEKDFGLVRGLDYYTGFVFEIVSTSDKLKGQSTIIGGGGYSNIFKELGHNEDINCFGFAIGIERLLIAFREENIVKTSSSLDLYIANLTNDNMHVLNLMLKLRDNNIACDTNFMIKKLDKHFKYAERFNTKLIAIIGQQEINNKQITIKNQKDGTQLTVNENELIDLILNINRRKNA